MADMDGCAVLVHDGVQKCQEILLPFWLQLSSNAKSHWKKKIKENLF